MRRDAGAAGELDAAVGFASGKACSFDRILGGCAVRLSELASQALAGATLPSCDTA
ncbi:conserved protein of unknown function [Ectopseudomonas oleovorans]|uniref:Uncharacterized protein n=1 Tax=Ectopseudomonas oleovorans TaxID=301 RepID=A0A653B2Y7_ECTOL|nr:conserved protein of unknown function [Pseudomonas oleovorans]